jgi:hypothetical protein
MCQTCDKKARSCIVPGIEVLASPFEKHVTFVAIPIPASTQYPVLPTLFKKIAARM